MMNANQSKYNYLLEQNTNYMDYVALLFEGQKITYEEFHENVSKYASVLRKKGIKAGDKVGVWITKRRSTQIMSFGVSSHHRCGFLIKAGGLFEYTSCFFSVSSG